MNRAALSDHADLVFWILFGVCGLVAATPFWIPDVLPLQDVGANLTYAVILHYHGTPGHPYTELYSTGALWLPNGLALYAISWLGYLVDFITAVRLVLSALAFLLPLALLALLRACGRSRWWAFFAFLLVFSYPLASGYLPFATSMPVLIWALALNRRHAASPTWRSGAALAAVACLVFWAHAQAYLYLGFFVGVSLLLHATRDLKQIGRLVAPFAPSLTLALPWVIARASAATPGADKIDLVAGGGVGAEWLGPGEMLSRFPGCTVQQFSGPLDEIVFSLIVITAMLAFANSLWRKLNAQPPPERADWYLEALAAAALLACFAFPYLLRIHTGLNTRMVPLFWLLLAASGRLPEPRRARQAVVGAVIVAGLAFHVGVAERYAAFQAEEVGGLIPLMQTLPEHSRLAYLPLDEGTSEIVLSGRGVFWHLYGYHFALNQGLAYSHFHRYAGRHAEYRPGLALAEPHPPLSRFLGSAAARDYEYLLLRTSAPLHADALSGLHRLGQSGRFSLWRLPAAPGP